MMPGSLAAWLANAPIRTDAEAIKQRILILFGLCASLLLFPHAALFFPIVERLAINFVDGSLGDFHIVRPALQEEVNVIGRAVGSFHIHASEVFAVAEAGESIVMHFDQ